jgi:hypothetical protein
MKKLTGTTRDAITNTWLEIFPTLGKHKPLHLLKRVGPLLVGVYLEPTRDAEAYVPIGHIHNLGAPFPVLSLGLKAVGPMISMRQHDSAGCTRASIELLKVCPFLQQSPVQLSGIVERHRAEAMSGKFPVFPPLVPVYDSLLVLALSLGEHEYAQAVAQHVAQRLATSGSGGREPESLWRTRTDKLLNDPLALPMIVEAEVLRHGVATAPIAELVVDVPPARFWE